ncbi:hypothetical protein [[Flexibacter] sp. ATCC 35208]|uniref:nSTAND1 domain-containing NTPase n=1 Tax=[Flexibacter] sp. ATCC 35208 TaxID=1936242 RepID=UPI0009C9B2AD|nr:hypothetical protein [[Flexibacter] sp. ATCC 35208]OMP75137.1 hypothetical protein BW716_31740 [[Flexibacter] sp. ATCC 35208]
MSSIIVGYDAPRKETDLQLDNPFRFLRSFKKEDRDAFSGRNEDVLNLYSLVRGRNIQLIFGESGVGKTSLVLCGLANHFKKSDWYDVLILRKNNIMLSIRQELSNRLLNNDIKDPGNNISIQKVHSSREGELIDLLYKKYYKPVYLIFDQIEELFLFGEDDEKASFFALMKEILTLRSKYCKIILIIRQEFHAKLKEFESKVVPIFSAGYEVKRVEHERAHEIIVYELERQKDNINCYPDVDTIAKEIAGIVGREGNINLLQLQVFLFYLWNRAMKNLNSGERIAVFTEHLVKEVGKLEDPLKEYLKETVEEITDGKGSVMWEFLSQFVSEQCTKIPINASKLKGRLDWLEVLTEKQVLRKMDRAGNYELSHDRLAPIIWEFRPTPERPRLMTPTIVGNPYKGLESYDNNGTDILRFFGRTAIVNDLVSRIMNKKSVAIVGASGTGKSSLIKAGILPRMEEAGYRVIPGKPGEYPEIFQKAVLKYLRKNRGCKKFVIYVDQFEELSTKCKLPLVRAEFIKFLEDKVKDENMDIRVILSIRSDYEYEFDRSMKNWRDSKVILPKVGKEEIREIITEPVYQAGLEYQPAYLVNIILEEGERLGNSLPLLSYTLMEMYEEYVNSKRGDGYLTEADYIKIGGVEDGLRSRAEAIFQEADVHTRKTIRNVVLRMVSTGLGEKAGRKVSAKELIYEQAEENVRVRNVLDKFLKKRLLKMTEGDHGRIWYEPAHDSLIKAWDRIDQWIDDHGSDLNYLHESLRNALRRYRDDDQATWDGSQQLEPARRVLESENNWFNKEESQFVRKSLLIKKERKERKKREAEEKERLEAEARRLLEESLERKTELAKYLKLREKSIQRSRKTMAFVLFVITGFALVTGWLYVQASKSKRRAVREMENAKIDKKTADSAKMILFMQNKLVEDAREKLAEAMDVKDSALGSVIQLNKTLVVKNKLLSESLIKTRRADSTAKVAEIGRANAMTSARRLSLAQSYESSNPALAYRILQRAKRLDPTNEEVSSYIQSFGNKVGYYERMEIDSTQYASFSGNGAYILTIKDKHFVNVYDTAGNNKGRFYEDNEILNAAFSPDGSHVLAVTKFEVKIYEISGHELSWHPSVPVPIQSALYDDHGDYVVAITRRKMLVLPTPGSTIDRFEYDIISENVLDVVAANGEIMIKTDEGVNVYRPGTSAPVFTVNKNDGEPFLLPDGDGIIAYKGGFLKYFESPFTMSPRYIKVQNIGISNPLDMVYTTIGNITGTKDGSKIFFTLTADGAQLQVQQQTKNGVTPDQSSNLRPRIFELQLSDGITNEIGFRRNNYELNQFICSPDGKFLLNGEAGYLGIYTLQPFKQVYIFGANSFAKMYDYSSQVYYMDMYSSWSFNPKNANIILTSQLDLQYMFGRTKVWVLGRPVELAGQKRLADYDERYLEILERK